MPCSVLVVEDDPHVRVVLDQLLQDQGLEVWSVGDDLSAYQVPSGFASCSPTSIWAPLRTGSTSPAAPAA